MINVLTYNSFSLLGREYEDFNSEDHKRILPSPPHQVKDPTFPTR